MSMCVQSSTVVWSTLQNKMKKFLRENKAMLIRVSISICLIIAGLIVNGFNELFGMALYLSAYIINGYKIIYLAFLSLFTKREIDEKVLMSIASLGAIITGAYFESALIMLLYLIGELIEDGAEDYAKDSMKGLYEICPQKARLQGQGTLVRVESIKVGEIIEIYAGERVPLDGVIIDGIADFDTSVVTGESIPVSQRIGNEIYAGYLNLNGVITLQVTRESDKSMVQRIIDVSLGAENKKSKKEAFIKKFAKIYTPSVIGLALLVAIVPPLFGLELFDWMYKAFALLAISCPCAIIISVPLAYSSAIGYAARHGVLVKGSAVLEKLSTLNTMAFDKTGTLTKAELRVNKVESYGSFTKMELLEIAGIAEKKSIHPIAMAIVKEAERFKITLEDGTEYKETVGMGIECTSARGKVKVGNYDFAGGEERSIGATVYVSLNDKCVGYIGVGDSIKENGKKAFDCLRENGIKKIYVLSGDKKSRVDMVASTLYADGAYSQLLPEHKLDALEDIISSTKNTVVGYCGDGINDLPSLSRADVGISMGSLGSDSAIEKSDVVITDDNIEKISKAYDIAKKTKKTVIANIILAIGIKALVAILNIVIPAFPMFLAVAADVGVMLVTILIALGAGKSSKH